MHLRTSPELEQALVAAGVEMTTASDGLVFEARDCSDAWDAIAAELGLAFDLAQQASRTPAPIVFVVDGDDLLGRRGAARAMVATGLLSASRTAAAELAKSGTPVNTLAIRSDTDPATAARWVNNLIAGGTSGELVRLGTAHIGKALP